MLQRGILARRVLSIRGHHPNEAFTMIITDATPAGQRLQSFTLEHLTERMTAREILRARIWQEVADYNQQPLEEFRGLVGPDDAQRTPKGWKMAEPRKVDWETQFRSACAAYKIHLGSANVLMAPNDRYLSIVPGRRREEEKVFLPFEGDSTLSLILSKAFLLAADTRITDPSIQTQMYWKTPGVRPG